MPSQYKFMKIPVGRIDTDTYQRDEHLTHISNIVADFDLDAVHVPLVSERDGKYYAIDGQQSLAAVKEKLGDAFPIDCKVFFGLSKDRENDLFIKVNKTKAVAPYEKFNARCERGDGGALDLIKMVESAGFVIQKPRGLKGITGTATLETVFKANPDALRWALEFVRKTWPTEKRPNVYAIAGLARFAGKKFNFNVDPARLSRALSIAASNTGELKRLALLASMNGFGGNGHNLASGISVAKGIMVLYNENRRKGTLKLVWGED